MGDGRSREGEGEQGCGGAVVERDEGGEIAN